MDENLHLDPTAESRESQEEVTWAFDTSARGPRDIPPPARPCLLIIPKQFQQLLTKYSSMRVYGSILIQTTIRSIPLDISVFYILLSKY